ncbi:helix-turn-helix domain-containing protein [Taibaiella soli]|uniref:DNA-binding protein n=1 Tax=Taibaiella soli TaxID=1649169 RepID=A0A2W2B3I6_9BACT|nr:helix-turn-helix domain-containing protein [Taibaiella soli]PZF70779.1 DNA-binding protein [Taibaiella soli]
MQNLVLSTRNIDDLINDVANKVVEKIDLFLIPQMQPTQTDRWFDLTELCQYLPDKPTKPTVYGWVNAGIIPVHKGGKKLRFLKSEIDDWLKQGRKKTLAETAAAADQYLRRKKKGGQHE